MNWMVIIALLLGAYLLGSIPSAVWIGKIFFKIDVREHGSGNAGATNVLRVLGGKAAIPVFIIDILKGFAAVKLVLLSGIDPSVAAFDYLKIALVIAAVLGHMFPVFAGFRGGKGVATLAGAMIAFSIGAIALCLATFLIVLSVSHYVSLGSMIAAIMLPFYAILCGQNQTHLIIFYSIISLLVLISHRANIKRLLSGTESKTYLFKRDKPEKK